MIQERLELLAEGRRETYRTARSEGAKLVGFLPGPYIPEELIYASGALPVCLAYGGNAQTADHALSLLPPIICPFARAQVGEILLKTNPLYEAVDMVVVPSTCQHLRKVGDVWEYREPTDVFKLGVPYDPSEEVSSVYFRERLADLRGRLENLTGAEITDTSIREAIAVYERLRRALRNLSLLRKSVPPAISGLEFVKLNHASLLGDPVAAADLLEAVCSERSAGPPSRRGDLPVPRTAGEGCQQDNAKEDNSDESPNLHSRPPELKYRVCMVVSIQRACQWFPRRGATCGCERPTPGRPTAFP